MRKFLLLIGLTNLLISTFALVQAQEDMPYMYYYSRILGGLIIEHPDGTDSRIIGKGLIPVHDGFYGPGWSPSGKYFAAFGRDFGEMGFQVSSPNGFVIGMGDQEIAPWLTQVRVNTMEWSPTGDILLVVGGDPYQGYNSFWLISAETGEVLSRYSGDFEYEDFLGSLWTTFLWELAQERLRFYTYSVSPDREEYFQITMQFDGTVLKEPSTADDFYRHYVYPEHINSSDVHADHHLSPSGDFEIKDKFPAFLTNHTTNETIRLPIHSMETAICKKYVWSENEEYVITLSGTLVAGGGCGAAVSAIMDTQGLLWRELGRSLWDGVAIGWLPDQVDISLLPPGQPKSVQLDPVAYESAETLFGLYEETLPNIRLVCNGTGLTIIDGESKEMLFELENAQYQDCPYDTRSILENSGVIITMAYEPNSQLLAAYTDPGYTNAWYSTSPYPAYVTIWSTMTSPAIPILRLNTYGYELEFTPDGSQLRARNLNAWKIYDVADILAAAGMDVETLS